MDYLISTSAVILAIILIIIISLFLKEKGEGVKALLFGLICLSAISYTVFLSGNTVLKNVKSETKGPVHWHADFLIYKCGVEVKLKSPEGISNRIGEPLLHEHGDKRIHVEGAVGKLEDVSLNKFFNSIGGQMTDMELTVPTNYGAESLRSGDSCVEEKSFLQVFVLSVNEGLIEQRKLENPAEYILAKETLVPNGDCIVIELDRLKNRTDYLCESYKAAKEQGKIYGR